MQAVNEEPHFDVEEDVRGGRCPLPMLRAKRALATLDVGDVVRVVATDPSSHDDFVAMLKHTPHELLLYSAQPCPIDFYETEFHFYIQKG